MGTYHSLFNIITLYDSLGRPCFHHPSDFISSIHQGLFITVLSLVDSPVGGEQRFASLLGNMCVKLISANHAVRKQRHFSSTDKKTRHLYKNLWQSCPSKMGVRGDGPGAPFKYLDQSYA